MNKNIIFRIMKFFNSTPLLHLSVDENFDTVTRSHLSTKKRFRLSLIALNFGTLKLYIFTLSTTPIARKIGFNFFYVLDFDKIQQRKSGNEISAIAEEYEKNTLNNLTPNERSRQEEFLKIRITENNDSLSNIFDKANYYTTVILAFSAALVYAYSKLIELQLNITTLLIFYLVLINMLDLLDLILLLRRSVSVSGFHRYSFKSLCTSKKEYALTKSLYFDFVASSNDVQYYAGLTKNTEMRSFRVILIGFFLLICTTIKFNHIETKQDSPLLYLQSYTTLDKNR
ncbi:hypothetical protein [Enterobacter sp.]|uniref:hypothetical protein n=1 Tax=Enterobacter sp. TaxID=42895 RepID=UPI00077BF2E5|nr:hypothetical protein [Enterobacter asburiae]